MSDNLSLIIYNLFPRVFPSISSWSGHIPFVKSMNFNCIYLNPFNETGNSRSLYAIKSHYKLNPEFLNETDPFDFSPVKDFTHECKRNGITVIIDLVINHASNESELVREYPGWFKWNNGNLVHPYAIDPANPTNVTVWGDLAEINYENNPDFNGLFNYWNNLIIHYQKLGVNGFRCDAAYKVPCSLWNPLIAAAKARDPEVMFLAESLGCSLDQLKALSTCGFSYIFNSSKWWDFGSPWCIEQHNQFRTIAPSIGFPESHDTLRQASLPPETELMQKCRYFFSAVFSSGLLMPVGYELGAVRKLDVVNSYHEDLIYKRWDISKWIGGINRFKQQNKLLCEEGWWRPISGYDWDLIGLIRESDDHTRNLGILINKDWYHERYVRKFELGELNRYSQITFPFRNIDEHLLNNKDFTLWPSEIVFFS